MVEMTMSNIAALMLVVALLLIILYLLMNLIGAAFGQGFARAYFEEMRRSFNNDKKEKQKHRG
jgi:hypothetical protein